MISTLITHTPLSPMTNTCKHISPNIRVCYSTSIILQLLMLTGFQTYPLHIQSCLYSATCTICTSFSIGCCCLWFAHLILDNETWVGPSTPFYMFVAWLLIWQTPNLAHYSLYAVSQLVPTTNIMLNYMLKPTKHRSFYKKYTSKKYLKFHPLTTSALLATHDPTL